MLIFFMPLTSNAFLYTSHEELCKLYRKALEVRGIKKISIGSGIRYDIALHKTGNAETDRINEEYLELVISKFVSGRLKVAPEHTSPKVLELMRKTPFDKFGELKALFDRTNKKNAEIIFSLALSASDTGGYQIYFCQPSNLIASAYRNKVKKFLRSERHFYT